MDEKDVKKKDFGGILDFFKSNHKWIIPVAIVIFCMFFAFYMRAQTYNLPITDVWARNAVEAHYKGQISEKIDQTYPALPDSNKKSMINEEYEIYFKQNKAQLGRDMESLSTNYKKAFKNEFDETYLVAIDPYYYLKRVENILNHGHPGEYLKDGRLFDALMKAPYGTPTTRDLHSDFSAGWHKAISFFNRDVSPMGSFFWVPVFLMILAVIPAFLIGKRFAGNFGGFLSAFLIAIHPAALSRTIGGFSDTDAYNIFFPLFIFFFFVEGISSENLKKKYVFLSLAALSTMLFALAWIGWFFIFNILMAAFVIYFLFNGFAKKFSKDFIKDEKHNLFGFLGYAALSGVLISLFQGIGNFFAFITGIFRFFRLQAAVGTSIWPNVLRTVAELRKSSLKDIISISGGNTIFFIGLMGILAFTLFSFLKKKSDKKTLVGIGLIIWLAVTIFSSFSGIRFTLLMMVPVVLCFGIGTSFLVSKIASMGENIGIKKAISFAILVLFVIIMIVPMYNQAKITAFTTVPSMNDAWHNSLDKINREASEDAIITSWWDFGHWFKAIAKRKVTFDGASQGTPQAHWVGNILITSNEKEAIGTLQMLDCGANRAFEHIEEITNDSLQAVKIVKEIIPLSKSEAEKILSANFKKEDVDKILEYSKCDPPEAYLITSGDMVGKAPVWSHFGSWDFTKAEIINLRTRRTPKETFLDVLENNFSIERKEAERLYYETGIFSTQEEKAAWISPWPQYYSGVHSCILSNNTIFCQVSFGGNTVVFAIDEKTKEFKPFNDRKIYPEIFSYNEGQKFVSKKIQGGEILNLALNLIEENGKYYAFVCDKLLTASTFTKLFFHRGAGTERFELFSHQQALTGDKIFVWKVKW